MNILGRAILRTEGLRDAIYAMLKKDNDLQEWELDSSYWSYIYKNCNGEMFPLINNLYDFNFKYNIWPRNTVTEEDINKKADQIFEKAQELLTRSKEFSSPLKLVYTCELFDIISLGSEKSSVMLPKGFVEFVQYRDYDNLSAAERKMLLNGDTNGSDATDVAIYGGSVAEAREEKARKDADIKALQQKIKDVEDAKAEGLAELKKEIERMTAELRAKQEAMKAELELKKKQMDLEVEKMKFQIHLLDSEIYAIRCYTGETVEFHQIRTGTPASQSTPLVFHQKMRYLDEELGRLASIYNVDFSKHKIFDELLKYSPAAFELFAPTSRSIMLARVSKSNKRFAASEEYLNALDDYQVYHGTRVCIILRDGENLWTAWTDDERIQLKEDAFLRPSEVRPMTDEEAKEWEQSKYEDDESYEKRIRAMKMKNLDEGICRMFVFSILQGVIDRGMIQFPEKVNVQKQNPYIAFTYADQWLDDNRYGTLTDILNRFEEKVQKGDMILTVQSLAAHQPRGYNKAWSNDRGIGEMNRTHDVYCNDRTVYAINKIVHSAKYRIVLINRKGEASPEEREVYLKDEELRDYIHYGWSSSRIVESHEMLGNERTEYYVSLRKLYSQENAKANFKVNSDEFWNLTFLNSVVLEYVLSTKKTDGIYIGGARVDFNHVIPYLKTALEHTRAREEKISDWLKEIAPDVLNDAEWPVKLSDWMLENNIHNFSEYRTKQFVKWLSKKD